MKIVMIIDSLVRGGRERRFVELLKRLDRIPEISTELVILSKRIEYPEIHTLEGPIHILERNPKKDPRVFFRFFQICKKSRPDIIQSWGVMSSIYAAPTVKLLKIPFINFNIYNAPGHLGPFSKSLFRTRLTHPFSDVVLGNSKAGLKAYRAPVRKSQCIYNGFDLQRIQNLSEPEILKQHYNIQSPYVVGMVGAFQPRKDYATFIQAGQLVLEKNPEVTFLCIGDGPTLASVKALVPARQQARFVFTGQVNNVESFINLFDIGILATNSKVHGEGISNAILEYMALKKPVIATNGGGTPEIIVNNETGYIIPPFSPQIMAEKILNLLAQPEIAQAMGQKGYQRVQEIFSMQTVENQFIDLYRQLVT